MELNDEQKKRVIAIAKALGYNGKEFTAEQIAKVSEWMDEVEVQWTIAQMVLDGQLVISFDNTGELMFAAKP